jgi:hypothetical protein
MITDRIFKTLLFQDFGIYGFRSYEFELIKNKIRELIVCNKLFGYFNNNLVLKVLNVNYKNEKCYGDIEIFKYPSANLVYEYFKNGIQFKFSIPILDSGNNVCTISYLLLKL